MSPAQHRNVFLVEGTDGQNSVFPGENLVLNPKQQRIALLKRRRQFAHIYSNTAGLAAPGVLHHDNPFGDIALGVIRTDDATGLHGPGK